MSSSTTIELWQERAEEEEVQAISPAMTQPKTVSKADGELGEPLRRSWCNISMKMSTPSSRSTLLGIPKSESASSKSLRWVHSVLKEMCWSGKWQVTRGMMTTVTSIFFSGSCKGETTNSVMDWERELCDRSATPKILACWPVWWRQSDWTNHSNTKETDDAESRIALD